MDTDYQTIIVSPEGAVVTATLNRPEKKNAINSAMWNDLTNLVQEVDRNPAYRVLVLKGAGGAFSSGADLTSGPDGGPPTHPLFVMDRIHAVALALHQLSKPAIAWVDGDAIGAGCNLALGCDMVFATPRSRFGEIFVRRGLSVDFGGSWILPRLIGLHRAKLLCLTGDLITAAEAASIGMINEVLEQDELEVRVKALVDRLLAGAPLAQALTKRLLNEGSVSTMAEALQAESAAQSINSMADDAREARMAFVEKREPRFSGR
ncbi:MAG: enoyl-CoA hydratase/isomerase family protein [Acidimicrobiales bacterium]|nr:enoyl-CoA hydratase/isomerase family protein [Acidimicrobiales bacterium]